MEWLNYHHLLYFWTVAREGTIARASEELRLAQPTISGQIRVLEDQLGEKLFQRSGRNLVMTDHVHPTAFGQVWIAERALQALAMDVRVWPSTLIHPGERSRLRSLQGDWTYVYRALKEQLRAAAAVRRAARAASAHSDSPGTATGRTPAGP